MNVSDIAATLEAIAPSHLAADWDNVGLLVGDGDQRTGKLLLCIDFTASVLDEAVRAKTSMVMAYHPAIFKGATRITPAEMPAVFGAIRHGISIYSMHTALDVVPGGTNEALARVMGLDEATALEPTTRAGQCKLVVFVPPPDLSAVAEAAFAAGAGHVGNYYDCAFFSHGVGTFCGQPGTRPTIGRPGQHEATEELRLEMIVPRARAAEACAAIRDAHSYEEPAIDLLPLEICPHGCGMGRVGRLKRPVTLGTMISRIKKATGLKQVLVAAGPKTRKTDKVTVAACGAGSCGDLWKKAVRHGAELYVTGELRHHDALAAATQGMTVICLGHSNSERPVLPLLKQRLAKDLPQLKVTIARTCTDPFEVT